MKKYILVGDTHGKIDIVEKVLKGYKGYHKVFIGDYVDSFAYDFDNQINIVRTLIDAVRTRTDVTALLGNHELSYLMQGMQCSGYSSITNTNMTHLSKDITSLFKSHLWIGEDILVTHAGASSLVFNSKEDITQALLTEDIRLFRIGYYRGGNSPYGGIYWCDFWKEFKPIEGITQIVGHTAFRPKGKYEGVIFENNAYNIDCLDRISQGLLVQDDGHIEIIQL